MLGGNAKLEALERGISFYDVLNEQIASVSIDEANVMFQPFVAQPSIHVNAKGNFFNMDQNTTYAEICYAVAEGVGFIHKKHIDFLINSGLPVKKIRFTGGIAKSSVWSQIFSNILKVPLEVVDCDETGALGVAIAAGIAAGVYKDYEDAFEKAVKISKSYMPDETKFAVYDKRYKEWEFLNNILMQYWNSK